MNDEDRKQDGTQAAGTAPEAAGVSRRAFLQGTGISLVATTLFKESAEAAATPGQGTVRLGPGAVRLELHVNGKAHAVQVEPRATLAEVLRYELGLTGTKIGCDRGSCSACTVHLAGTPVCSCMMLAVDVGARPVTTVEGLARGASLHRVQEQLIAHDAMQCGFCTPGMVMSCAALLERSPRPSPDEVKAAIAGNLCRCGTHPKVVAAVLAASGQPVPPGTEVHIAAPVLDQRAGAGRPHAGEPPPWPESSKLDVVGKPTPRVDGKLKVTGGARYTADVRLPGMLFARRIAATVPHAHVKSIDTRAAEALPGVKAVHILEKSQEGAVLRSPAAERFPTVRYAGQTIGAVAATSQAIADEAARLVRIDYEPLPFTVDLDEARAEGAPLVYPGPTDMPGSAGGGGAARGLPQKGNVRGPNESRKGDVAAGFKHADVVVEGEFRTQVQTHSALEPHGVVADFQSDRLTVHASTQGTATVREELAEVFKLPRSSVHVITEFMGAGFGAKFGAGSYGVLAAHLSKKAGAPVRLVLDRKEEHLCVGNRPATRQKLRIGARKDGTLTAMELSCFGTAGVGLGAGVGPWGSMLYPAPNFHSAQYDVFINAGPGAAFRAPGAPQALFALEQLVDELAGKLGMDPLALRDRIDAGDDRADREARRRERAIGAEKAGWSRRHPPGADRGPIKRGLGVAQSVWGRFVDLNSSCEVRLHRDGSIEVLSSVQDIGTGTRTALAQIVAEELGVRPAEVTMRIGDTSFPIGPSSGGSKTLLGITSPARTAAWRVKRRLLEAVAPVLGLRADDLDLKGGNVVSRSQPLRSLPLRSAAAKLKTDSITEQASRAAEYGGDRKDGYGGVQFVEVAVDTETGVIKVERVVAVHECGRLVNPLAVQSQVNGGVIHGLSWALYEHRMLDRRTGHMVNPNLDQYKIAGVREIPTIEVVLLDQYQGRNATDVNGIGEPANAATAAAIANAVHNALGVRIYELPMKPEVVLAALSRPGGPERAASGSAGGGRP